MIVVRNTRYILLFLLLAVLLIFVTFELVFHGVAIIADRTVITS